MYLSKFLIGFVAAEHLFIMWFEMFAWKSKGPKVFKSMPADLFPKTEAMAANQGLYNGFLAAGLVWSLCTSEISLMNTISLFFLTCVIIAGIYGALTIQKTILYTQALPAVLALTAVMLGF